MASDDEALNSGDSDTIIEPAATDSVEEYVDRERVRELLSRRERLIDALENRESARLGSGSNGRRIDQLIEQKARAYVIDLAPLITSAVKQDMVEHDYWNEYPGLRIEIAPPPRNKWDEPWMETPEIRTPRGHVTSDPGPVVIEETGLQAIIQYRSPLSIMWEKRSRESIGTTIWKPIDANTNLPLTFVEQVFRGADEFLRDAGLDVNLQGGEVDVEGNGF